MADEFDGLVMKGRRRWVAAILINLLVWGLLGLVGYIWLTRIGVEEIRGLVASNTFLLSVERDGTIKAVNFEETRPFRRDDRLFEMIAPEILESINNTSETISSMKQRIAEARQSDVSRGERENEIDNNIRKLQSEIGEYDAQIENRKSQLEWANENVALKKQRLEAAESLLAAGAMTRADVEARRDVYMQAVAARGEVEGEIRRLDKLLAGKRNELAGFRDQKQKLMANTDLRIGQLLIDMKNKEGELSDLRLQLTRLVKKAEYDGYVVKVLKRAGESVKASDPVLQVTDGKDIWIEAYFLPEDRKSLREGDRLKVRYQGQDFPSYIDQIGIHTTTGMPNAPQSMFTQPTRYLVVRLRFEDPETAKQANLLPGIEVAVLFTRQEGLLYRLGLGGKKELQAAPVKAADRETSATRVTDEDVRTGQAEAGQKD
jgi:multidrug resistance efflux pump